MFGIALEGVSSVGTCLKEYQTHALGNVVAGKGAVHSSCLAKLRVALLDTAGHLRSGFKAHHFSSATAWGVIYVLNAVVRTIFLCVALFESFHAILDFALFHYTIRSAVEPCSLRDFSASSHRINQGKVGSTAQNQRVLRTRAAA